MAQFMVRRQIRRGEIDALVTFIILCVFAAFIVAGLVVGIYKSYKNRHPVSLFPFPIQEYCTSSFVESETVITLTEFQIDLPFQIIAKGTKDNEHFARVERVGGAIFTTFESSIVQRECGTIFAIKAGMSDEGRKLQILIPEQLMPFEYYENAFGIMHYYDLPVEGKQ